MADRAAARRLTRAVLAGIPPLMPVPHPYPDCEATTAEGHRAWRECGCRDRWAARRAAAVVRELCALIGVTGDLDLDEVLAGLDDAGKTHTDLLTHKE